MQLSIAKKIAFDLLKQENLLQLGWRCDFDDAKHRLGCCKRQLKLITLSRYYIALNPDEVTLDTIRHEVAHAVAPPGAKHGELWKKEAVRLGAAPVACADSSTIAPEGFFVGTCPNCGQRRTAHRDPAQSKVSACGVCCKELAGGRFDARFVYRWRNEKTNTILNFTLEHVHGIWEKDAEAPEVSTETAAAFVSEFGALKVIELKQIGKLPEFRFDDYDFRVTPEGVFRALLEVKMFRDVKQHKILKTYWRTLKDDGIVIDVWANTYNGGKYETADKRTDVEKLKVGNWYELIVMKTDKGFIRLQSAKASN